MSEVSNERITILSRPPLYQMEFSCPMCGCPMETETGQCKKCKAYVLTQFPRFVYEQLCTVCGKIVICMKTNPSTRQRPLVLLTKCYSQKTPVPAIITQTVVPYNITRTKKEKISNLSPTRPANNPLQVLSLQEAEKQVGEKIARVRG